MDRNFEGVPGRSPRINAYRRFHNQRESSNMGFEQEMRLLLKLLSWGSKLDREVDRHFDMYCRAN